jgi:hypothetical protein
MHLASTLVGTKSAGRARTARTEKRIARAIAVELSRPGSSQPAEETITDNVSLRGARVVTKRRWQPEERVLLKSLGDDLVSHARVVYCERLPGSAFAVGLYLLLATGEWGVAG